MKGCRPKHFCFSALRAWSSTRAAWKRNRLPPRKMTAQKSCLFLLNNSNLLWKSNPKYHLHWISITPAWKSAQYEFFSPRYTNKHNKLCHQSGDGLKVSELEWQIANEYHAARNAHFKTVQWDYCTHWNENTIPHKRGKYIWSHRNGCAWPIWS